MVIVLGAPDCGSDCGYLLPVDSAAPASPGIRRQTRRAGARSPPVRLADHRADGRVPATRSATSGSLIAGPRPGPFRGRVRVTRDPARARALLLCISGGAPRGMGRRRRSCPAAARRARQQSAGRGTRASHNADRTARPPRYTPARSRRQAGADRETPGLIAVASKPPRDECGSRQQGLCPLRRAPQPASAHNIRIWSITATKPRSAGLTRRISRNGRGQRSSRSATGVPGRAPCRIGVCAEEPAPCTAGHALARGGRCHSPASKEMPENTVHRFGLLYTLGGPP